MQKFFYLILYILWTACLIAMVLQKTSLAILFFMVAIGLILLDYFIPIFWKQPKETQPTK